MRLLDLFSGIGGFSLGLERAGFRTVAFCEVDPFCRRVLAKHWPRVPCYDDVRTLTADRLAADGIAAPDAICGGFPCQDISSAGKGAGIDGERSGLWREYARIIRECRPAWVIIENVPALRTRGADRVLGDLEAAGYAARPLVVGAVHAGAPHRRQRVWIVANAARDVRAEQAASGAERQRAWECGAAGGTAAVADTIRDAGIARRAGNASEGEGRRHAGRGAVGAHVADAGQPRLPAPEREALLGAGRRDKGRAAAERGWWSFEPDVGRVAHGVPQRVDRLRALGNAVVPQVVEAIGRAVITAAREDAA